MSQNFPISKLTLAILSLPVASLTHAAGLDRSGQDIKGFFNDGTYAEVDYAYIDTDISGYDNDANIYGVSADEDYIKGGPTGNMTQDSYTFMRYGVKTDINDAFSIGVFYDEPWGAEVEYEGNSKFVGQPGKQNIVSGKLQFGYQSDLINPQLNNPNYKPNSKVSVHTESWTGLLGYKADGLRIFGGPVLQKAKANVRLSGQAYGPLTGYDASINTDSAVGWVAGVGYSVPEIALKANLTYRSKIEHEAPVAEYLPIAGSAISGLVVSQLPPSVRTSPLITDALANGGRGVNEANVKTPESVNLNFQTGLSEKYQLLGTLDVRWVPWSDFSIVPPLYNALSKASVDDPDGLALIKYSEDQWKVDVGLAKRFNERLAGSIVVGWDSGAGDPTSTLGTVDGYYSIGGGMKFNMTPEWAISAGGKYLNFGDATGALPNGSTVSKFEDNDGYIAGVKLSYQSL